MVTPAKQTKKAFVIGGGPAGMEAAIVAATRGHKVTLFEKNDRLGGQLLYAVLLPYKDEWNATIKYLNTQLNKLNVEIRLNEECTVRTLEEGKPDSVIVATGATPCIPDISGVNGKNVATAIDVLTGKREVGQNVVIVGGGSVGCETAEFLAQRGKKVTILEMLATIGADYGPMNKWVIIDRLIEADIRLETAANVEEITERGVRITRVGSCPEFFEADSVVLAVGATPVDNTAKELEGKVPSLHKVGDCVKPCTVKEAIESGFRAALLK